MKPSVIFPAVLSGLAICYARGDFTKETVASLNIPDILVMAGFVIVIGTLSFLIVKGWDRLMGRRKVRSVANHSWTGSRDVGGTRSVRSRDLGSRAS